jgi:hypothetical protein
MKHRCANEKMHTQLEKATVAFFFVWLDARQPHMALFGISCDDRAKRFSGPKHQDIAVEDVFVERRGKS